MYLLFFVIFSIVVIFCGNVKEYFDNVESKNKFRNDITNTYIDSKGGVRDCETNKQLIFTLKKDGTKVYQDMSGNDVINITQCYNKNSRINAIKNNKTVYEIQNNYSANDAHEKCIGHFYRDLKNGKTYTVREIKNFKFYMDIDSGMLIRLCDSEIKNGKKESDVKEIIKDFNNSQEDIKKIFNGKFSTPYSFYLNSQDFIKDE